MLTTDKRAGEAGARRARGVGRARRARGVGRARRACGVGLWVSVGAVWLAGCAAEGYRHDADRVAYDIIAQKQREAIGRTEPLRVESAADTLRRRLLASQGLAVSHPASLGTKALGPVEHWPDDDYLAEPGPGHPLAGLVDPGAGGAGEPDEAGEPGASASADPLELSLELALQVAAANSRTYQSQKESVFLSALDLDLERDAFRNTFASLLSGSASADLGPADTVAGLESTSNASVSRLFKNGVSVTGLIGLDLVKLLTQDQASSSATFADASISIPLMRGAGEHIVAEPLTQAERNTIYAIWQFERFKREFAVDVASDYLGVLQQLDAVENVANNYRSRIITTRRLQRLVEEGREPQVDLDLAFQQELQARDQWIRAQQQFEQRLDNFKILLGLPTDAAVVLDRETLSRLAESAEAVLERVRGAEQPTTRSGSADAAVELTPPDPDAGGPLELEERVAVDLALRHRLDLQTVQGRVYDAQRNVVIAADNLRAEVTLLGNVSTGARRSLGAAGAPSDNNAVGEFDNAFYEALLTIDLPLERTRERNLYREAFIVLEQAARDVQDLEDRVKLQIRNSLRDLLESRESLRIQALAVRVAQRQEAAAFLNQELGRGQIRDILDAQDDLIAAENQLTAALVDYRIAELALQRDMGLLEVDETGLWREFNVKGIDDEPGQG